MVRRLLTLAVVITTALAGTTEAPAAASTQRDATLAFGGLNPGGLPDLNEKVPTTIVFVGFEAGQIDKQAVLDELPATYAPVVRSRLFYGLDGDLGLRYTFKHKVVMASDAYENALFGALAKLASPAPITQYQELYNLSDENVETVDENHFIDAPSVERWLAAHPPRGVDPSRNTVFFINWYGRDDFRFHVYTKFGEPDPDTGYDFGQNESRKLVAWGGTAPADEETGADHRPNRIWFYDVSAGPESWNGNYDVIDCESVECPDDFVPFDIPETEYRIPLVWEYASGGYRDPTALSADLGKLTRFVAINLLFVSSPLYPPYLTPTRLPRTVNLDSNTYEGWPGVNASAQYVKPDLLRAETEELIQNPTTFDNQELPFEGTKAEECYVPYAQVFFTGEFFGPSCYPERPNPPYPTFANLFLHHALNRDSFTGGAPGDYEAMAFNFALTDEYPIPFLGFADDNFIDGTQSFVYNIVSPAIVEAGYGLTTTQIHEYGHHWGMSHPHDGWDSELGLDYGPSGDFFFAWSGDESNSIMSYIDVNWDFSQFDQDNHLRHRAAAFMLNANMLAEQVLAKGRPAARAVLRAADLACAAAKLRLRTHDYSGTFRSARRCYDLVRRAAEIAGVPVTAGENGWFVLPADANVARTTGSTKVEHLYAIAQFGPGLAKRMQP